MNGRLEQKEDSVLVRLRVGQVILTAYLVAPQSGGKVMCLELQIVGSTLRTFIHQSNTVDTLVATHAIRQKRSSVACDLIRGTRVEMFSVEYQQPSAPRRTYQLQT